jgi:hypothetical protein
VLDVRKSPELNTVLWNTLSVKFTDRLKQQSLAIITTLGAVVVVAVVIWFVADESTVGAGADSFLFIVCASSASVQVLFF